MKRIASILGILALALSFSLVAPRPAAAWQYVMLMPPVKGALQVAGGGSLDLVTFLMAPSSSDTYTSNGIAPDVTAIVPYSASGSTGSTSYTGVYRMLSCYGDQFNAFWQPLTSTVLLFGNDSTSGARIGIEIANGTQFSGEENIICTGYLY